MRILFATLMLCCVGFQSDSLAAESARRNIVFIMIDDLGWMDLRCQGNPRLQTPCIDRLATNLIRGCKNCNNAKRDQFPKRSNRRLLIDPCSDEPLDFIRFDFETGMVIVNRSLDCMERATTTRDVFNLNHEPLREARRWRLTTVLFILCASGEDQQLRRDRGPQAASNARACLRLNERTPKWRCRTK